MLNETIEELRDKYLETHPNIGIKEALFNFAWLIRAKQREVDNSKFYDWLRANFYHEETMCDSIAYMHEDYDVEKMIDDCREAMEV